MEYSNKQKIELKEQTRGTNRIFTFNSEYLITVLNESTSNSKVSSTDWENIEKQINLIELSRISLFAVPTTWTLFRSSISFYYHYYFKRESAYQSVNFGADNPPKELASLYKTLQQPIQNKRQLNSCLLLF